MEINMSSKKYTIRIGDPCSYEWENMSPVEKGRHCAQCDKVVTDFTSMNDEDIIHFLLKNKNACGHFHKSQLDRTIVIEGPKRFKMPYWPAIAAMLVAGMFQLAPTYGNAQNADCEKIHEVVMGNTSVDVNTQQKSKISLDPSPVMIEKTGVLRFNEDSSITIRIKVVDSKDKKPLPGANVKIAGVGDYTADDQGYFTMIVKPAILPEKLIVSGNAYWSYSYYGEIDLKTFIKNPYYQLEFVYQEPK